MINKIYTVWKLKHNLIECENRCNPQIYLLINLKNNLSILINNN